MPSLVMLMGCNQQVTCSFEKMVIHEVFSWTYIHTFHWLHFGAVPLSACDRIHPPIRAREEGKLAKSGACDIS